ncbi:MAG TPA: alpha-galactosidase [Pseudonocardiaceae bacterium]
MRWTLRTATTSYTVALPDHRRWLELHSWGPHGIEHGPSPLANLGRTPYLTEADAAPAEYIPFGQRPFTGADLVAERESFWQWDGSEATDTELRAAFADELTGLRVVLCYRADPAHDVLLRWVEIVNTGDVDLRLNRFDSAGVCVPVRPLLTLLAGSWAHEFQRRQLVLPAGRFEIGSTQGVPGHAYAPWLAVQDVSGGPAWGVSLAWSGSWRIDAEVGPAGLTRIRAGRRGPVHVPPGGTLVTPAVALAFSEAGLDGLSRAWHRYERGLARDRPTRVLYNSWEATEFAVDEAGQLELAVIAADLGVELFVVDDGWFTGRHDDTAGLGDWAPEPVSFPDGFGAFVDRIRLLGLDFGLWIEPECVNPKSRLYADHPDWVYRSTSLIRNQLVLNLGRADVFEFVRATLDRLLTAYPISYLKWDMNRPDTAIDGDHVRNYLRLLDFLRAEHPGVTVEGCAAGGARVDPATIERVDVVWPSDNTGPMDRLAIQHGFLHAHAPHLMSSWVTDSPGFFDVRPRSLAFRFVLAMAGVLGIGADIRSWTADQRTEAARFVARYKEIRHVIHQGDVRLIGSPTDGGCAVQYTTRDKVVVLAWHTGDLTGVPRLPGRADRFPLLGLDDEADYVAGGVVYRGAHLHHAGLPITWTADHDADVIVLDRA